MPKPIGSNSKGDTILKQGHTATKAFGADPTLKGRYASESPRELKP